MIKNLMTKIRSKLFLKISLIFVISLAAVLISTLIIHRTVFMSKGFPRYIRNITNHANYMVKEIGFPPDLEVAKKISEKMQIPIMIKFKDSEWASKTNIAGFNEIELPDYPDLKGFSAGFNNLGICVLYKNRSYKILLVMHKKMEGFRRVINSLIIFLLGFVILVIAVLYFFLRWLLRPVRILKEGVDQVISGNLDVDMPVNSNDELGKLTISFNSMTNRIGDMIRSRDQLLRDVSHELRSPLTRIKIGLELLEDSEIKKGILSDVSEVNMMISELLETDRMNSRFGKLELEDAKIHALIEKIVHEFEGTEPGIEIGECPEDIELNIDMKRVMILLRNIFSNALRYSHEDSMPVHVSCVKEKNKVVINVKDSGIGIPEDELLNIFEPFYRIDKSRSRETGGYGLGMSLSKKIMDAHNGKIEVKSFPGNGTLIKLIFDLR